MEKTPPFLLLMPSYNQAHFIGQAVRSVLSQDDANWELWVVDNSTDNTPDVIREFPDPRIHFHHSPTRMDPGSCLNWMLQHSSGRDFSYIHTDNNLDPTYVRKMRAALATHPLALAYCDMRTIDDRGKYINMYRRGAFDLPRLLSVDTLGVPFAATTALAEKVGGFSEQDFADDVRFCVGAFGIAEYVYMPEPLLNYRLHNGSRTVAAGGGEQMQRVFADLMPTIVVELEQRGVQSVLVMEEAIRRGMDSLDFYIEDLWYRKLSRYVSPWWRGHPRLDHFFFSGLMAIPGFTDKSLRPPHRYFLRADDGKRISIIVVALLRLYLRTRKRDFRRLLKVPRNILLTWATSKLGVTTRDSVSFRIRNFDFRTLWMARQLELTLGWKPKIDVDASDAPPWLTWGQASGTEPLLDCSGAISLTRPNS